jgi:hypothetical protein
LIGDEKIMEYGNMINAKSGVLNKEEWFKKTGRYTYITNRQWNKDDELLDSGLIGPVKLESAVEVEIPLP